MAQMEPGLEKPVDKKRSRQQRRFSRTRGKILEAARSVFAEKGLAAATIDEIAERADVGRGSVYYHFENKDELISLIIGDILSGLSQRVEKNCVGHEDLGAVLDAIIGAHLNFFSSRWEDFVLFHQGRADMTLETSYEGIEKSYLKYLGSLERLIDEAMREEISDLKLSRLAFAIAGFISGYYSFVSVAADVKDVDKSFVALRSAFVASLARFVKETVPEEKVRW
ncbi:MAG: TetR/AcrR family transcriptional regulator [bacterium]